MPDTLILTLPELAPQPTADPSPEVLLAKQIVDLLDHRRIAPGLRVALDGERPEIEAHVGSLLQVSVPIRSTFLAGLQVDQALLVDEPDSRRSWFSTASSDRRQLDGRVVLDAAKIVEVDRANRHGDHEKERCRQAVP